MVSLSLSVSQFGYACLLACRLSTTELSQKGCVCVYVWALYGSRQPNQSVKISLYVKNIIALLLLSCQIPVEKKSSEISTIGSADMYTQTHHTYTRGAYYSLGHGYASILIIWRLTFREIYIHARHGLVSLIGLWHNDARLHVRKWINGSFDYAFNQNWPPIAVVRVYCLILKPIFYHQPIVTPLQLLLLLHVIIFVVDIRMHVVYYMRR